MNKPIILNIETSTNVCSVSLIKDENIYNRINRFGNSHAELLTTIIEEVVSDAKINFENLSAIAVSEGPGSYTGLRIGVSVAKGLCYSLNIPLMAINPLLLMAIKANKTLENVSENYSLIPMMDARRMEVYTAVFNHQLNQIKPTSAIIINENFIEESNQINYLFGDGANKAKEIFIHRKNIVFIDEVFPDATHMIELSNEAYNNSAFVDTAYFEPFYLKNFIAGKPSVKGLN